MKNQNIVLIAAVILLAAFPLAMQDGAEFGGTDDQAKQAVSEVSPNYQPWFSNLWEPPSSEVESLLFALQAALGAGFIGYYFGYFKGKASKGDVNAACKVNADTGIAQS